MALSDYERRVLREIESDLGRGGYSRWFLLRGALRRLWLPIAFTVVAVAACVVAGLLLIAPAAVGAAAVAAFTLGFVWGLTFRTRVGGHPHPR